jgi:hypothetical protein
MELIAFLNMALVIAEQCDLPSDNAVIKYYLTRSIFIVLILGDGRQYYSQRGWPVGKRTAQH